VMPSSKPEPPRELLEKIEEIGDIKRHLSLRWRMYSSTTGLYVQSGELPDCGVQYMAGGGQWRASLVFEKKPNGSYSVRRYKPGEWELQADKTLSLCRLLERASRVPEGWPDEKRAAYQVSLPADPQLVAEVQVQFQSHLSELELVYSQITSPDERDRLTKTYLEELETEWPIEYLDTLLLPKHDPNSLVEATLHSVLKAYLVGYMAGKEWITELHMAEACIDLGQGLASTAKARRRGSRCNGTGFGLALAMVATKGRVLGFLERQRLPG